MEDGSENTPLDIYDVHTRCTKRPLPNKSLDVGNQLLRLSPTKRYKSFLAGNEFFRNLSENMLEHVNE